ncbi:RimJ/RimL family protein N-acetyltransferase [Mobilisporobacter senegalensis]|uniref:RimJ/RimL family protein N-acetyltransferase n=1 Tax=Mobilisporobacter senegalensis TaxID=1329262 RepID=A0A3N1XNG1_9FIRM|nr:GNAT family N-acetyltransferase [Mobilisporobacter senegalensis]ROR28215.1 RimJ/RimL family protein N-acetyltransferase [Mobilisporobacter senegalensis]
MDNVVIKTARTIMKFPLGLVSAEEIINAISDRETLRYMDSAPYDYTIESANNFIDFLEYARSSKKHLELGVFDNKTNIYIGMMTLGDINLENNTCELGYWISKPYTGKGIATECASELLNYANNVLGMKTINAYVITGHSKSIALLEKLGFQRKDLLKNNTKNKGVLVDRYWYIKNM